MCAFFVRLQIDQKLEDKVVPQLNEILESLHAVMSDNRVAKPTTASVARNHHIDSQSSHRTSAALVDSSKSNAAEIESSKDLMAIDDDEALREEIKKDPPPVDNNAALPADNRKKAPATIQSEKEEALLDHAEKDYFDEKDVDEDGDDDDDSDDDEVPAKDNGSPLKKKQKTDQEVLDIKDSSDDASVDDDDFVQDDLQS
jgi:hypothetical protein